MGIVSINKLIMGSCNIKTSDSEEKPTSKYSIGIDLDGNRHEFDVETIKPMYPDFSTADGGYDDDAEWDAVQDIANQLGLDPEGWWEEDVEWTDEEWEMFDEKYIEKYGFKLQCVTHQDEIVEHEAIYSFVGGDKLTSIGEWAFSYCSSLSSISLPNVTSIGEEAFTGCTSLTSLDLPKVTSISREIFGRIGNNSSIKTISIPNVTSIGDSEFNHFKSLSSIDLSNATSIGKNAFSGCTSLTSINLQSMSREYIENNASGWCLGVDDFGYSFEVHVKCKDGEFILNEK